LCPSKNSPVPIDLVLKYAKSPHKVAWQTIDRYYGENFCKTMAVFYKIVKLVKNGVLMIIHIYAKVSNHIK
jgi:hypothetical protein